MKYKALVSCAGVKFSFAVNHVYDLHDEALINDLVNAKFIELYVEEDENVVEEIKQEVKVEKPAKIKEEKKSTAKSFMKLDASELEGKKTSEIKDICRSMGIKVEGTKAEMIAAILKEYNG